MMKQKIKKSCSGHHSCPPCNNSLSLTRFAEYSLARSLLGLVLMRAYIRKGGGHH